MMNATEDGERLVVAFATSALFDLRDADTVFREHGEAAYRAHQRAREHEPFAPGPAFPFLCRLLALRSLRPASPPVEAVLLSRNDPDTGLRAMRSLEALGLPVERAAFVSGGDPWPWMKPFGASLFLTADANDVDAAIALGLPAGQILSPSGGWADPGEGPLRVAFDFDGVLADDASEKVFRQQGLSAFQEHERLHAGRPLEPGPLLPLFKGLAAIQRIERDVPRHRRQLLLSIVTARGAPAHERVVNTLRAWDLEVDEALFLSGSPKAPFLRTLRPHLFMDDQLAHLHPVAAEVPCVHVPFGVGGLREHRYTEASA